MAHRTNIALTCFGNPAKTSARNSVSPPLRIYRFTFLLLIEFTAWSRAL